MGLKQTVLTAIAQIRADTSQLPADLKKAEKEVEASAVKIEATASAAATKGASKGVTEGIKTAVKPTKDLVGAIGSIFSLVTRILGIIGLIVAGVTLVVKLVDNWANKQDRIRAEAQRAKEEYRAIIQDLQKAGRLAEIDLLPDEQAIRARIRELRLELQEKLKSAREEVEANKEVADLIKDRTEAEKQIQKEREEGRAADKAFLESRDKERALEREISDAIRSGDVAREKSARARLQDQQAESERRRQRIEEEMRDIEEAAKILEDAAAKVNEKIKQVLKEAGRELEARIKGLQKELDRFIVRTEIELVWEPLAQLTREIRTLNQNLVSHGASTRQLANVIDSLLARDPIRR